MNHYARGFLNESEGMAAYEAVVRTSNEWNGDGLNDYMSANITLTDCSRKIHLEFDVCSKEELESRKVKVKLLLKVVQEFHDKFMEASATLKFEE